MPFVHRLPGPNLVWSPGMNRRTSAVSFSLAKGSVEGVDDPSVRGGKGPNRQVVRIDQLQ